jgi:hypothetical protein
MMEEIEKTRLDKDWRARTMRLPGRSAAEKSCSLFLQNADLDVGLLHSLPYKITTLLAIC